MILSRNGLNQTFIFLSNYLNLQKLKNWMLSSTKVRGISLFIISLILSNSILFAQSKDSSSQKPLKLAASMAITNNGISLIPTFTLGKPAAIFNFTVGKRLTFEPDFLFSLEGKPWASIYWLRYKLVRKQKFNVGIRAHHSVVFNASQIQENNIIKDEIKVQRFLAAEIVPTYTINKNISVGVYYLTSAGSKESTLKRTHFITLNASLSNLKLHSDYTLAFTPQIYYLKMDKNDGYYYSASATISKATLPISIQGMFNQPIKSNIIGGQGFVWNMSLIYSFNKLYTSVK